MAGPRFLFQRNGEAFDILFATISLLLGPDQAIEDVHCQEMKKVKQQTRRPGYSHQN